MRTQDILTALSELLFQFDHPAPAKVLASYAEIVNDSDDSFTADDAQGVRALLSGWGSLGDIVLATAAGPDADANRRYRRLLSELGSNMLDIIVAARRR